MSGDDAVRQLTMEKDKRIQQLKEDSKNLLDERVAHILNLPQQAQTKNIEGQKI